MEMELRELGLYLDSFNYNIYPFHIQISLHDSVLFPSFIEIYFHVQVYNDLLPLHVDTLKPFHFFYTRR